VDGGVAETDPARPRIECMTPRVFTFGGGLSGGWRVTGARAIAGDPLPSAERVAIHEETIQEESGGLGPIHATDGGVAWTLRGVVSNHRYVRRDELDALRARQAELGRREATHAALIPILKSEAWWALAQDERRAIFEERSRHVADTLRFLPAIARRLHHCRDLGGPFDFLTWFEWAPEHDAAFDDLVGMLRSTEEWTYVTREVDIRLAR
jgi:hypothetical protein